MRVSGLLITHQLTAETDAWFAEVNNVVDELVAFVDEDRAGSDVHARLEKLNARIFKTHGPAFYNFDFAEIVRACAGDWILKVDYDEELSPEWQDPRWREILEQNEFSHFWSPRRWITQPGKFIDCEPWWPDWQCRLFRNKPEEITFPTQLHETMRMEGPSAYLRTLAIHHHDVRLASRQAREGKAHAYDRERPGRGLGYFYLFDDYAPPESPLARESAFAPGQEILRMEPLGAEDILAVSLRAAAPAKETRPGALFWVEAEVMNQSGRELVCGAPFPVNLAYHWLDRATRKVVLFDGERTAILPGLPPKKNGRWKMFVIAPDQPGEYLLQLTMVQEGARWLEMENPNLPLEFPVTVGRPEQ